ncbi:MAG: 3-oxoacyl-ACP synthase III family protein [Flavobacteriaceae bacterium]|nr:3-oxoacyl-ACP synthase III family protein [Flavobacteriaceae bacterium]
MRSIITGTGSYIPKIIKKNSDFLNEEFYSEKKETIPSSNEIIIEKFRAITGIEERRYLEPELNNSNMGAIAAQKAIDDAKVNPEEIDQIIYAHNYGDIRHNDTQSDCLPSLAARVKHFLKIKNPDCVAYDIIYGCPGWVQGVIQADNYIQAGIAKKCLIIAGETLSRVVDPHDRDSMIYADGAGACILEKSENNTKGIISFASQSFTFDEANYLFFGESNKTIPNINTRYIKMYGRKIYEFALNNVPNAMKQALDKSGIPIDQINKILIHQANEKMDEAIIKRFYRLCKTNVPKDIMPMSIKNLGNSSVATVPTLLDLILKNNLEGHQINEGDTIILASVGAGMHINAIVYQY